MDAVGIAYLGGGTSPVLFSHSRYLVKKKSSR